MPPQREVLAGVEAHAPARGRPVGHSPITGGAVAGRAPAMASGSSSCEVVGPAPVRHRHPVRRPCRPAGPSGRAPPRPSAAAPAARTAAVSATAPPPPTPVRAPTSPAPPPPTPPTAPPPTPPRPVPAAAPGPAPTPPPPTPPPPGPLPTPPPSADPRARHESSRRRAARGPRAARYARAPRDTGPARAGRRARREPARTATTRATRHGADGRDDGAGTAPRARRTPGGHAARGTRPGTPAAPPVGAGSPFGGRRAGRRRRRRHHRCRGARACSAATSPGSTAGSTAAREHRGTAPPEPPPPGGRPAPAPPPGTAPTPPAPPPPPAPPATTAAAHPTAIGPGATGHRQVRRRDLRADGAGELRQRGHPLGAEVLVPVHGLAGGALALRLRRRARPGSRRRAGPAEPRTSPSPRAAGACAGVGSGIARRTSCRTSACPWETLPTARPRAPRLVDPGARGGRPSGARRRRACPSQCSAQASLARETDGDHRRHAAGRPGPTTARCRRTRRRARRGGRRSPRS